MARCSTPILLWSRSCSTKGVVTYLDFGNSFVLVRPMVSDQAYFKQVLICQSQNKMIKQTQQ